MSQDYKYLMKALFSGRQCSFFLFPFFCRIDGDVIKSVIEKS